MKYSVVNYPEVVKTDEMRFDAEYYKPYYLQNENIIIQKDYIYLIDYVDEIRCGPFGSTILASTYSKNGVIVVRPFNIKNGTIENNNLVTISNEDFTDKKLKAFSEGDIFFSRVGDIKCGIVPRFEQAVTISPNIIGVKVNQYKLNPYYLAIYFNSKFGKLQIERALKVVAQPTISTNLIGSLKVIKLSTTFQYDIEIIVKKCFAFNKESAVLCQQAKRMLLCELRLDSWVPKNKLSFVKNYKDTVKAERFDAEHYQPQYDEIEETIKTYPNGWSRIADHFAQNNTQAKTIEGTKYNYIEIGGVNIVDGSIEPLLLDFVDLPANAKIKLNKGDIIVSKVRTYRGAVAIIDRDGLIGSGAFISLQETGDMPKEVLFALLKTEPYLEYSLKFNVGTSYPTLIGKDILNYPIPLLSETTKSIVKRKINESIRLRNIAQNLFSIAKNGVEMAIEKDEQTSEAWIRTEIGKLGIEL